MKLNGLYGCGECAHKEQGLKQRTPFEEVVKYFEGTNCVLMEDGIDFGGCTAEIKYICSKHAFLGEQKQTFTSIKMHGPCKFCRLEKHRERKGINLKERERIKPLLNEWRIAVFERDKFTCQCCGYDKGKKLRAHHIQNFAEHPHLRLDIDNGITLCSSCHDLQIQGSFHHVYGTRKNTKQQLEEYIRIRRTLLF